MKKFFVDSDGKSRGECLTDAPVNPDGYLIVETDFEPERYTAPDISTPEEKADKRKRQIKDELFALDLSGIRQMREIALGRGKAADVAKLTEIDDECKELREELNGGIAATDELAKTEVGFFKRIFNRMFS